MRYVEWCLVEVLGWDLDDFIIENVNLVLGIGFKVLGRWFELS